MDVSGSYTLRTPREQVWDGLLDPDILKSSLPGCESVERTGDNIYAIRMNVDVAGIKGSYQGTLQLMNAQRPESFRLVVDGTGVRGILHGDGVVRLEAPDAGTTVVHYSGQVQLGGAIASVGTQVGTGAANRLIKQYFAHLATRLPEVAMAAPAPLTVDALMPPPTAPIIQPHPPAHLAEPVTAGTPEPVDALMPPPTAPIIQPRPPAHFEEPTQAQPAESGAVATAAEPSTPVRAPATNNVPQPQFSNGGTGTEKNSARTIGIVIAIIAALIVVVVVWLLIGPLR